MKSRHSQISMYR